jgi:hypothetical protein
MEWLFSKTFIYPLPPSGLQDILVTGYDRSGAQWIGSTFYQQESAAYAVAADLENYVRGGGLKKYDLGDPKVNPKPLQSCYWQYQILAGGLQFLRIGDVTGPDKNLRHTWTNIFDLKTRLGWQWSKDPNFAFLLKHYFGRKTETDAEWREIEAAASKKKRAPFLESKSRVVPMWAGILESGTQHDDFRFRRASYLRVGQGWGHHHDDTLDLQIVAHGLPMTLDGGQRPGYSKPDDRDTRVHNLVEVDGQEMLAHSWVNALSDVNGARYMRASLVPPSNLPQLKHYSRQVALIDVDEGSGSKSLPPEMTQPSAKLEPVARTANSYTFDVVRVSGGKRHTYAFHGPVADPDMPQPMTNARDVTDIPADTANASPRVKEAAAYLDDFYNHRYCGTAPENFEATFPIPKKRTATEGIVGAGTEAFLMGPSYDPQSPDKFLKLHLMGAENATVMKGDQNCRKWNYFIPHIFVEKQGAQLDAPFTAVIEPYEGKPFISSTQLLPIVANESDALRAVAAQVETTNGRTDVCFADGRPSRVRTLGGSTPLRVAGEFAYLSRDSEGLREASLTGGKILGSRDILLQPAASEQIGKVVKADYKDHRLWLDKAWPSAAAQGGVFEIGTPEKHTEYTATSVRTLAGHSQFQLDAGADYYQSRVREVDAKTSTVTCALGFSNLEGNPQPGLTKGWVASNDSLTRFWRAEYLGGSREEGRFRFKLTGGPVSAQDFGKNGALRLWEFGVGDSVRQSTFLGVRRVSKGLYEVQANVACRIGLPGKALSFSTDGRTFKTLPTIRQGALAVAAIRDEHLAAGRFWVRAKD